MVYLIFFVLFCELVFISHQDRLHSMLSATFPSAPTAQMERCETGNGKDVRNFASLIAYALNHFWLTENLWIFRLFVFETCTFRTSTDG
jgi:hypothetical protein